jgi:muramidase (phage lysozyme)
MTGITFLKRALRKSFSPAPIRKSISETTRFKEPNTKEKFEKIVTNQNMPSSATHKYNTC